MLSLINLIVLVLILYRIDQATRDIEVPAEHFLNALGKIDQPLVLSGKRRRWFTTRHQHQCMYKGQRLSCFSVERLELPANVDEILVSRWP